MILRAVLPPSGDGLIVINQRKRKRWAKKNMLYGILYGQITHITKRKSKEGLDACLLVVDYTVYKDILYVFCTVANANKHGT